ncbi:hypothetical protein M3647_23380 [Paenibacillus cellulositrophicus]|uniref:hypothetical protein n=1 Tax=Paenibacillus cellulositrophicus TaxID=562959 RepID=UPI00203A4E8B|nr:hypothetical protein [Paenibacillus cellulositrophicus]MCM3000424.1 hypothetical protein [Paenibacillus cellulositrophicus]
MKKTSVARLGFSFALATGLICSAAVPSFAASENLHTDEPQVTGSIDLNNLNALPEGTTIQYISYEEMINDIAKDEGISVQEAKEAHPKQVSDGISIKTENQYAKLFIPQKVNWSYGFTLKIYCYVYNVGSFKQFKNIETVQLDMTNTELGGAKSFGGSVEAHIDQSNVTQLHWLINGHIYDTGTWHFTGSVTANGLAWSGGASIEYETNEFAYWYKDGTYSIYDN